MNSVLTYQQIKYSILYNLNYPIKVKTKSIKYNLPFGGNFSGLNHLSKNKKKLKNIIFNKTNRYTICILYKL